MNVDLNVDQSSSVNRAYVKLTYSTGGSALVGREKDWLLQNLARAHTLVQPLD